MKRTKISFLVFLSFFYPYVVTALLAETTILWEPKLEGEALGAQKLTLNVLC